MTALCVDDEPLLLESLLRCVKASSDIDDAMGFENEKDALIWSEKNNPDIAFLDIQLHEGGGINLAEKLRQNNPDISIVFCKLYFVENITFALYSIITGVIIMI